MPYTVATATWNGTTGLPGYTKIKFLGALTASEASTALAKLRTFFAALGTYIPALVSISFSQTLDQYADNGDKTGIVTASSGQANVQGTAAGAYNAAAGAWVTWASTQFVNGRRVSGRTFLVPLGSAAFQSDGTLLTTFVAALQSASDALLTGFPNVVIYYHRQRTGEPLQEGISTVAAAVIKDKGGVLRSRRD